MALLTVSFSGALSEIEAGVRALHAPSPALLLLSPPHWPTCGTVGRETWAPGWVPIGIPSASIALN